MSETQDTPQVIPSIYTDESPSQAAEEAELFNDGSGAVSADNGAEKSAESPQTANKVSIPDHIVIGEQSFPVYKKLNGISNSLFRSGLLRISEKQKDIDLRVQQWVRNWRQANQIDISSADLQDERIAELAAQFKITKEVIEQSPTGIVTINPTPSQKDIDEYSSMLLWDTLSQVLWKLLVLVTTDKETIYNQRKAQTLEQYIENKAIDYEVNVDSEQYDQILAFLMEYIQYQNQGKDQTQPQNK